MTSVLCLVLATSVAVTVDDLPRHGALSPGHTRLAVARTLLDAFRRHQVPSVYGFVNGAKVAEGPELEEVLAAWRAAGQPIGNHGFSHLGLNDTPVAAWAQDIARNEPVLERFAPGGAWHYFRFPFLQEGDTLEKRDAARSWLAAHGYRTAQVTIDFDDWAFNAPYVRCLAAHDAKTAASLREQYVANALNLLGIYRGLAQKLFGRDVRHVLLLHAGELDADRIDALLTAYERAGVTWVDLPSALADPIYALDPRVAWKAGATLLDQLARARKVHFTAPWNAIGEDALDKICR